MGELIVRVPGVPEVRVPLLADRDVAPGGFMPRMRVAAQVLYEKIAEAM
ncbi:MAG: hypothetical protein AAGP08_11190 [Pseudomonadota bacterium]